MNLYHRYEELYEEGMLGLIKAASIFDPNKGYTFSTLAATCIRNQILMTIRKDKKICITISLEDPVPNSDNDQTYIDILASDFNVEEDYIEKEELERKRRLLHNAIKQLDNLELTLLNSYYNDDYKLSQCEIAKKFNMSQSSFSRRLKEIINKLKEIIEEELNCEKI